jgi:hypothetical protein
MRAGLTLEKAAELVAPVYSLEPETIMKIYSRKHIEAKADLAMTSARRRSAKRRTVSR